MNYIENNHPTRLTIMPRTHPSSSKKKPKVVRKRKKPPTNQSQEALSNVCNITGLDNGVAGLDGTIGGLEDNVMDCLDELACAQVGLTSSSINTASDSSKNNSTSDGTKGAKENPPSIQTSDLPLPPPPPPGIHQIPNLRIELARHLQTQTLSTFLLQSCHGLRMPTFERWLLDSKMEESDRFQSIIEAWMDNPSLKLAHTASGKSKKKYGRAAMYLQEKDETNAQHERENSRKEKDCKLLLDADKRIPARIALNHDRCGYVGSWIRNVDRDPILPNQVMESDSSCDRLLREVIAALSIDNSGEESDQRQQKGREIVRELCHRTTEACKELYHLEQRLGKYQKFGWDSTSTADRGGKKKRKTGSGSSGGGNVDKIHVEWNKEGEEDATGESPQHSHQLCSLVYVPKKRKSYRPASLINYGKPSSAATNTSTPEDNQIDDTSSQHKPKPFVIKLNASHYHKLRAMFDATYNPSDASTSTSSMTKEQSAHAFNAALFAVVIRYSSMSGGQLLNDWRGGGMQGAVHEGVFDCLSKWFGGSASGTECFASPFNSTLSGFFSAFPSPDLDGHFGSHGDFFHPLSESDFLRPGWYELNPPFSPGVMSKMAHRIGELLDISCKQELDVAFIVVIPTLRTIANDNGFSADKVKAKKKKKKKRHKDSVQDDDDSQEESNNKSSVASTVHHAASQSFRQLINSPYLRSHIVLPAREHGYIEGGQHLRPTKFKESQYSTSVIILRSKSWIGTEDAELFEKELRDAFASRHAMEVEQRKERSMGKMV